MALVYKRRVHIASVGDSRAYRYRPGGKLFCITGDPVVATDLAQARTLKPTEVASLEQGKLLYRYLGQTSQVQIDYFECEMEPNDLILLCTNGLWHMLRDERIEEILARAGDPQKLAQTLMDEANLAGGDGNVSVIAIRVL
jgi:serine/threonine protein phosphatase PrpC